MKCFIGFFLIVSTSLVLSSPAIDPNAHDHHKLPHEETLVGKIHLEDVKVLNNTHQVSSHTPNATTPAENVTLVAPLYTNASSKGNELGHHLRIHENCSHCMDEIRGNDTKKIGCMCGLFAVQHPKEDESPLFTTTSHNVSCHESVTSQEACNKICISVAKVQSDLEAYTICPKILNATNVSIFLQSKICENGTTWNYTGYSTKAPLCCHNGLVIHCKH